MKLRILNNSIRLRLDRSELRELLRGGSIERRTVLGPSSAFVYALHAVEQDVVLCATASAGRIDVFVDHARARDWAASENASLGWSQDACDMTLRLLLEKDFPCQHTSHADADEKFTPGHMRVAADASVDG